LKYKKDVEQEFDMAEYKCRKQKCKTFFTFIKSGILINNIYFDIPDIGFENMIKYEDDLWKAEGL